MKTLLSFIIAALITTAGAQIAQPIINGANAAPGEFPSTVAILDIADPDNVLAQFCGGTLIHPRWVLTAAHCFTQDETIRPALASDPRDFQVLVGTHDLENGGRRVDVLRVIIHPDYDPVDSNNDIALLLLAEEITDVATTALVRQDGFTDPMTTATVTGWGNTDPSEEGQNSPSILQKVNVPIATLEVANELEVYDGTLTENMLPAGDPTKQEDSCQGDSGGPLYVPDGNGSRLLAGIVSFGVSTREGFSCGNTFGIYTKVQNYTAWIDSRISFQRSLWEQENAVSASPEANTDSDAYSNFQEYAFDSDPNDPASQPRFQISRTQFSFSGIPKPQLTLIPEISQDFTSSWAIPEFSLDTIPALGSPELRNRGTHEGGSRSFLRLRAELTPTFEIPLYLPLKVPGAVTDSLNPGFALAPPSSPGNNYVLEIPDEFVGIEITVSVQSNDFPATIQISGIPSIAPQISLVPESGKTYFVSAIPSNNDPEARGSYTLATFVTGVSFPTITTGETKSGTLESTDATLPWPESYGEYPADTYLLTGVTTGSAVKATISGPPETDLTIEVLDRETGRFLTSNSETNSISFTVDRSTALRVSSQFGDIPTAPISYTLTLETAATVSPDSPFSGAITEESPSYETTVDDEPAIERYEDIPVTGLTPGSRYAVLVSSENLDPDAFVSRTDGSDDIEVEFVFENNQFIRIFTAEADVQYFATITDDSGNFGSFTLSLSPR